MVNHCPLRSRSSRVSSWEKNHLNIGRAGYWNDGGRIIRLWLITQVRNAVARPNHRMPEARYRLKVIGTQDFVALDDRFSVSVSCDYASDLLCLAVCCHVRFLLK